MGWYSFLGLKEIILLVMVVIAILIAIFLTFIEVRMSKLLREGKPTVEEILINKLKIYSKSKKPLKDKLDYLNLIAKWYFRRAFNLDSGLSYSQLTNEFSKLKKKKFEKFCKGMFESYYAKKTLGEKEVLDLYHLLIRAIESMKPKELTEENPVLDKFDRFLLIMREKYTNFKINLMSRLKGLGKAGKVSIGEEISENLKTRIIHESEKDKRKDVEKLKKIIQKEREKRKRLLREMKETKELLKKQFELVRHEKDLEEERKRWMKELEAERVKETIDYKKTLGKKIKSKLKLKND